MRGGKKEETAAALFCVTRLMRRKAQPVHDPPALMDKPLHVQICSVPFAYVTLFLSMHIFRQGFLLATVGPQVLS